MSSLTKLAQTLDGRLVVGHETEREEELILMIGAMGLESFAARLDKFPPEKSCVIVGDRWDIQNIAIREGVRVLIVTGGISVEPKTIEAARKKNVSVITSPHDTATTASLCRAAVAVRHVLNEEFLCFREHASLAAVREEATASGYLVFPVLDAAGETVGIISKTDFLKPVSRRLILVDHNELSQAVQGADEVEIIEIIDHHRIGALATAQPILFRNEPVGSTSTIVADCFFRNGVELPKPVAGLLLAGVVADTLNLTSPTTTPRDAEVLKKLEELSQVNAREFTEKLFASGSLLTLKPAPQAITTDCKEYPRTASNFSVAQIEEVGLVPVLEAEGRTARARWTPSASGARFIFPRCSSRTSPPKLAAAGGRRREIHKADRLSAAGAGHLRTARRGVAQKTIAAVPHALSARCRQIVRRRKLSRRFRRLTATTKLPVPAISARPRCQACRRRRTGQIQIRPARPPARETTRGGAIQIF